MVKECKTLKLNVNEIDELKDLVRNGIDRRLGSESLRFTQILLDLEKKLDKAVS